MLELLLQAAHLFQEIMDPLEPGEFLIGLHALLLQKVERFSDVVLTEKKVGELLEDFFGIRPFRGGRVLAAKITIANHGNTQKVSVRVSVSVFFLIYLFTPTYTDTTTVFISRITRKGSVGKGLSVVCPSSFLGVRLSCQQTWVTRLLASRGKSGHQTLSPMPTTVTWLGGQGDERRQPRPGANRARR